jgi:hypothetical protein
MEDPHRAVNGGTPVIAPGHTFGTVTDKISSIVLARRTPLWWAPGWRTMLLTGLLLVSLTNLVHEGSASGGTTSRSGGRSTSPASLVDRHRPRRH